LTPVEAIRTLPRAAIAAGAVALTLVLLANAIVARPVENLLRDVKMAAFSPFIAPPADQMVLVTIDETTLSGLAYRSPVDRAFLAGLVTRIAAAGPATIGIDLLFDQPTEPEKDQMLEAAIQNAGIPVVMASAWASDGLSKSQLDYLAAFAPGSLRGLAALLRDPLDGVVRGAFAGREKEGVWQPGLVQAMAATQGLPKPRMSTEMVYYRTANAEPYRLTAYPAFAAMLAPPEWFKGKHVLIGVDLPQEDRYATPFAAINGVEKGQLPGVVIHAHSLMRLLAGDRVISAGMPAGFSAFLLFGGMAALLCWRPWPLIAKPPLVIGVILLLWVSSLLLFYFYAVHVPVVAPTIGIMGLAGFTLFMAWRRDDEERRFVRGAFQRYVSPAVVDRLLEDPGSLRLGGERRQITSVFTDLEGFTHVSEGMSPETLAALLNGYLDRMCDLFVAHGATIDKLIGDAVVGFYGAPADDPAAATKAVRLAVAIGELSDSFRREAAAQGYAMGRTRVGIHCGPAIVGNFGGSRFFDYTAIGDTVNTAARLEGANKHMGTANLISAPVAVAASGALLRPVGKVYLKGRSEGVEVFEALKDDEAGRLIASEYEIAYSRMEKGEKCAATTFANLASRFPQDGLVALHAARLASGEKGVEIRLTEK
jgi:adenylate cyclase